MGVRDIGMVTSGIRNERSSYPGNNVFPLCIQSGGFMILLILWISLAANRSSKMKGENKPDQLFSWIRKYITLGMCHLVLGISRAKIVAQHGQHYFTQGQAETPFLDHYIGIATHHFLNPKETTGLEQSRSSAIFTLM